MYIDNNASVPWEDLRYIFGEIMYGGHITDPWDRVQSSSYLGLYITDALFNGFELAPGFKAPDTVTDQPPTHTCTVTCPSSSPPASRPPTR